MNEEKKRNENQIQSVERALDILEVLGSGKPLRFIDIAKTAGLHKTTVHRLLKTLALKGYVRQKEDDNKYLLGNKFLSMAHALLSEMDLRTVALPFIRRLAIEVGTAVNLAILSENKVLYIEKIEAPGMPPTYSFVGKQSSVHCSGLGKAIMAFSSSADIEYVLAHTAFEAKTLKTITNKECYLSHLSEVREKGYAFDDEEFDLGIRCVAAPIFDFQGKPIGGISITGPTIFMTKQKDDYMGYTVKTYAALISQTLGWNNHTGEEG